MIWNGVWRLEVTMHKRLLVYGGLYIIWDRTIQKVVTAVEFTSSPQWLQHFFMSISSLLTSLLLRLSTVCLRGISQGNKEFSHLLKVGDWRVASMRVTIPRKTKRTTGSLPSCKVCLKLRQTLSAHTIALDKADKWGAVVIEGHFIIVTYREIQTIVLENKTMAGN